MIEINAYAALGLRAFDEARFVGDRIEPEEIRYAMIKIVASNHPFLAQEPQPDQCADALLAGSILLGGRREAHDAKIRKGLLYEAESMDLHPAADEDPVPWMVDQAISHGIGHQVCPLLPKFITADRLASVERLGLAEALREAIEVIEQQAGDEALPDRSREWAIGLVPWLRGSPVVFGFRTRKWKNDDGIVRGEAKKLTDAERAAMEGGEATKPTHRIILNLETWLEDNAEGRARLVHHELGHYRAKIKDDGTFKVSKRRHDVEEFTATMRLFGPASKEQVEMVISGASHPETAKRAKAWEAVLDEAGQSLLFAKVLR